MKKKVLSLAVALVLVLTFVPAGVAAEAVAAKRVDGVPIGTYICYADSFGEDDQELTRPGLTLRSDKTFSAIINVGYGMVTASGTWTTWNYEVTTVYLRFTQVSLGDVGEYELHHLSHPFLENDIYYHASFYTFLNDDESTYDNDDLYLGSCPGITPDYSVFAFVSDDETGDYSGFDANPGDEELFATPTASAVLVNGKSVTFDAYTINGNNYFKLRDLAYVLRGTEKQFNVAWDGIANLISLESNEAYVPVGGEMGSKGDGRKSVIPAYSRIQLNGEDVDFTAYVIESNNYFKLRDIGEVFDFGVEWDGANNTILIDTSKGYTPEGSENPPQVPSFNINDYTGIWYISGEEFEFEGVSMYPRVLEIHGLNEYGLLEFDLFYFRSGYIEAVMAEPKGNVASFYYSGEVFVDGTLVFNDNSITVNITYSDWHLIPVEALTFDIRGN